MTDSEAADYLRVSKSFLRAMVANGQVRRVLLPATNGTDCGGRLLRVDPRDLDKLIETLKS